MWGTLPSCFVWGGGFHLDWTFFLSFFYFACVLSTPQDNQGFLKKKLAVLSSVTNIPTSECRSGEHCHLTISVGLNASIS